MDASAARGAGGMPHVDFLNAVVDDAIEECRVAYRAPRRAALLAGCIAGLEACRGLDAAGLADLSARAAAAVRAAAGGNAAAYWEARGKQAQVDWVRNVLAAARHAHGLPTDVAPTARGLAKAMHVLNGRWPTGEAIR